MKLGKVSSITTVIALCASLSANAQEAIDGIKYVLQDRPALDTLPGNKFKDNMFLEMSTGIHYFATPGNKGEHNAPGYEVAIAAGKWFDLVNGMRLGAKFSTAKYKGNENIRTKSASIYADYVYNLSSYLGGYNPYRVFNLSPFAGLSLGTSMENGNQSLVSSLRLGLNGAFRVSRGVSIFVEPMLQTYTDNFTPSENWRGVDFVPTVMLGLKFETVPQVYRTYCDEFYKDNGPFSNLFVSAAAGAASLPGIALGSYESRYKISPTGRLSIGNWFNPYSGLRMSVGADFSSQNAVHAVNPFVQADYMFNLSSLFEGHNINRIFSIYGIAGLNYKFADTKKAMLSEDSEKDYVGLGLGMQGSFRLSNKFRLFIEPRVDVNASLSSSSFRPSFVPLKVYAGLTFSRPDDGTYTKAKFDQNGILDHYFLYMSGGANAILSMSQLKSYKADALRPIGSIGVGKWFTPVSGLRVFAKAGVVTSGDVEHGMLGAGLDYMLNISNLIAGHDPGRRFGLNGILGGNAVYQNHEDQVGSNFSYGLEAGVQGTVRVSPNAYLFLEPKVELYTSDFAEGTINTPFKGDLFGTVNVGFTYNFNSYSGGANNELFEEANADRWFMSVSGGPSSLVKRGITSDAFSKTFGIQAGKFYTPISSWRAGFKYESTPSSSFTSKNNYYALELDYLLDLTTYSLGFKKDRVFNLSAIAGLGVGLKDHSDRQQVVPGIHAGLQGRFRLTDDLSIFIEPKGNLYYNTGDSRIEKGGSRPIDLQASGLLGLMWKFKSK